MPFRVCNVDPYFTTVKIDDIRMHFSVGSYADDGFTILDITTPESPLLLYSTQHL